MIGTNSRQRFIFSFALDALLLGLAKESTFEGINLSSKWITTCICGGIAIELFFHFIVSASVEPILLCTVFFITLLTWCGEPDVIDDILWYGNGEDVAFVDRWTLGGNLVATLLTEDDLGGNLVAVLLTKDNFGGELGHLLDSDDDASGVDSFSSMDC